MNEGLINRVACQLRYQLEVKDLEEGFYNPSTSLHTEASSPLSTVCKVQTRYADQREKFNINDE